MRIIVGCEFSQILTNAFRRKGHDAYSCDLLPTEGDSKYHFQEDILKVLKREKPFEMGVFFPPCTDICRSGGRWFKYKEKAQQKAIQFFMDLVNYSCSKIAIENPIGIMSIKYKKPDQIIQPWMFGHGETKATCLWLKGLPALHSTNIVKGREPKCWKTPDTKNRWKIRSRTHSGIAEAMADQWTKKFYCMQPLMDFKR